LQSFSFKAIDYFKDVRNTYSRGVECIILKKNIQNKSSTLTAEKLEYVGN